jgi:AcrR family transcriptional regulator
VTSATTAGARRGRPRSDASEHAIVTAALDLLAEGHGVAAITINEVARRAGVGKDTVYRRWRSKDDLLLDALATLPASPAEPREGPIREVLVERVAELVARMHDDRNQRIYRSVLCAGTPELRERFFSELIEPRRRGTRAVIAAAIARGELRDDVDPALLGMLLYAPLLAEILDGRPLRPLRGAPLSVAVRLVDAALRGALR